MERPTFADLDRIAAAREKKKYELIERLSKAYVKLLDFDELVFARSYSHGIVFNEAYERARTELEAKRR